MEKVKINGIEKSFDDIGIINGKFVIHVDGKWYHLANGNILGISEIDNIQIQSSNNNIIVKRPYRNFIIKNG